MVVLIDSSVLDLVTDRRRDEWRFEQIDEEPDRVGAGEVAEYGRVEKNGLRVLTRHLLVEVAPRVEFRPELAVRPWPYRASKPASLRTSSNSQRDIPASSAAFPSESSPSTYRPMAVASSSVGSRLVDDAIVFECRARERKNVSWRQYWSASRTRLRGADFGSTGADRSPPFQG